jgi:ribose 5-phosphate isomerase A
MDKVGTDFEQYKKMAAERGVEFVESGMVLGLGSGSTALLAIEALATRMQAGKLTDIVGIPCSRSVEQAAEQLGIPLTTLAEHPTIDLTIDGADEVDPQLNLIKGGGGALLREKITAQVSRREIIVIDERKLSPMLGTLRALPIEVIPFGWETHVTYLETLGAEVELRRTDDGETYLTDEGNYILDCRFGPIDNLDLLDRRIKQRAGIVEDGLFLGLASDVIVAGADGIRHIEASSVRR